MLSINSEVVIRTPVFSYITAQGDIPSVLEETFLEGLFLSSIEFYHQFERIGMLGSRDVEKIKETLLKFYLRSSTKCTPFGTFSGCTVLPLASTNKVIIKTASEHKRVLRLDSEVMAFLIKKITSLPEIREQVIFHLNNTIYELHGEYRFINFITRKGERVYQLSSVEKTEHLDSIMTFVKEGATLESLNKFFYSTNSEYKECTQSFVLELITNQLLIPETTVQTTGLLPMEKFLQQLERFSNSKNTLSSIQELSCMLNKNQTNIDHLLGIRKHIESLVGNDLPVKNFLQADTYLNVDEKSCLHKETIQEIVSQVDQLTVFSREYTAPDLDTFKKKFYLKFGDATIPLSHAVDSDFGIPFGLDEDGITSMNELFNEIFSGQREHIRTLKLDFITDFSLAKYNQFLIENSAVIVITENEINRFKKDNKNEHRLPESMYIMGKLLTNEENDPRDFKFDFFAVNGPAGANLLGRFAHGNSRISNLVRKIVADEEAEYPDCILAEIVHESDERMGNIVLRPCIRTYEIPCLGISGIGTSGEIPISDLYVKIVNDQLILFSYKHQKRVIPRLTTAHNFDSKNNIAIYRFLCSLQLQGYRIPVLWDWGALADLSYLPRVMYKNIILKRARWILREENIKELYTKTYEEIRENFERIRDRHQLPNIVYYIEGENELMLNLLHPAHVQLLLKFIKKNNIAVLEEFLFNENNSLVRNNDNAPFINEIVIPVNYKNKEKDLQNYFFSPTQGQDSSRFLLGSQWLYFKIYGGTKQLEKFTKHLQDIISELKMDGLFEKFFFIRYKDDFNHLRIRFYNSNIKTQQDLQFTFIKKINTLIENGVIERMQIDFYVREIDRYGKNFIEESESIFYHDSVAVLRAINLNQGRKHSKLRLFIALNGIDMLLEDFEFTLQEKHVLLHNISNSFFTEHGGNPELRKKLNNKYKDYQKEIFSFLNKKNDIENGFYDFRFIFKQRSKQNVPIVEIIKSKIATDHSEIFSHLLQSYIHMFVNRLFIAEQRKYELVTTWFLEKYYRSQLAICSEGKDDNSSNKENIPRK